jgi:uncharacterized phage protein (TIGR02220 family)
MDCTIKSIKPEICQNCDELEICQKIVEMIINCRKQNEEKYDFIKVFNNLTGKRIRILDSKTKRQLNARQKEGFTPDDFEKAINNCLRDPFHKQNPKYLTPEFITRADKLQKYLNDETNSSGNFKSSFEQRVQADSQQEFKTGF